MWLSACRIVAKIAGFSNAEAAHNWSKTELDPISKNVV